MGRKAQVRRAKRDAAKNPDIPVDVRRAAEGVMQRLQDQMASVETRLDFEELIAVMPHPVQQRALLTPFLRPNLPCCPSVILGLSVHAPGCPEGRVTLT